MKKLFIVLICFMLAFASFAFAKSATKHTHIKKNVKIVRIVKKQKPVKKNTTLEEKMNIKEPPKVKVDPKPKSVIPKIKLKAA
jgi:hypothetical protein